MSNKSFPNRRSVLRVEELSARSLPAVLNPAAAVVGDTVLVSSAGDEPADDTTTASDGVDPAGDVVETASDPSPDGSTDLPIIDEGGLVPSTLFRPIFWSGLAGDGEVSANPDDPSSADATNADGSTADASADDSVDPKPNIFFRPLNFSGLPADGSADGVTETDANGDPQPVVCDFGMTEFGSPDAENPADDGSAVPGDSAGDAGSDPKPNIFFRPLTFGGLPADGSADGTVETDANGDPIQPVVCDFGPVTDPAGPDGTIPVDDGSAVPVDGEGDWGRDTNPKYYFRTLTGNGVSEDGAGNENVDGSAATTDSTDLADDSSLIPVDAGVPVPGDESDIPTVQTFGGSGDDLNTTDDGVSFLAYSTVPPAKADPVLDSVFVPLKAEPAPAGAPIDGSAWTFFATKRDDVASAPATVNQSTPVTVTVSASQTPANAAPAASVEQSQSISLDSSAVKKLLGDLSIEQQ